MHDSQKMSSFHVFRDFKVNLLQETKIFAKFAEDLTTYFAIYDYSLSFQVQYHT